MVESLHGTYNVLKMNGRYDGMVNPFSRVIKKD
jgi:hypothetical protein